MKSDDAEPELILPLTLNASAYNCTIDVKTPNVLENISATTAPEFGNDS